MELKRVQYITGSPCSRDTRLFHSRRDLGTVGDRGYFVLFKKSPHRLGREKVEHSTLNIQGTESAYAENPDGTVADKKIEKRGRKKKHVGLPLVEPDEKRRGPSH